MAGKIVADIIEAPAGRISLNVANVTVASINASGLYTSTGNLLITQANSIATAAIEDGAVTNAKLTLTANASNVKTALNASGDAPIYAARAWVNFDGLTNPLTIRASGNVSSVTDNGTGDYTINFTTAMPDANYALTGTASNTIATRVLIGICPRDNIANFSTTSIRFEVKVGSGSGLVDSLFVSAAIFR